MILLTIHVNFEYCYGIKKLECDFEFNDNVHVIAVYASNGMMKSSFAKTFRDLQKNTDTIDKIYPDANSIREIKRIKNNNSEDIGQDEVYVTIPFENEYNEDSVSTILAEPDKRKEYADAHKKIDACKKKFIGALASHSKYSLKHTESIINETFGIKDFYDIFEHVKDKINDDNITLSKISHKIIFDQKVQLFLKSKDASQYISEYFEKYEIQISLENSPIFANLSFISGYSSTCDLNSRKGAFVAAFLSIRVQAFLLFSSSSNRGFNSSFNTLSNDFISSISCLFSPSNRFMECFALKKSVLSKFSLTSVALW